VKREPVLRMVGKLLIPYMLVFALYVQVHGDYGPGGGFQAGVISAAAVIFYAIIFGLPAARRVVPEALVETMVAAGAFLYLAVVRHLTPRHRIRHGVHIYLPFSEVSTRLLSQFDSTAQPHRSLQGCA
jgi:multisubunit Na+/H+ antiporter MnhB subunit